MLKKTAVAIPLLICVLLGAEEIVPPLKNMDFSSGLTHWRSASAIDDGTFAVIRENNVNVLQISGGSREVSQLVQTVYVSPEKLLNKRVNLFAEIKPAKITCGSLHFMIREVNAAGKTVRYRTVKIDKWTPDKWNRYNISLKVNKPTKKIQVYIKSNYLRPEDRIFLKNIVLNITSSAR